MIQRLHAAVAAFRGGQDSRTARRVSRTGATTTAWIMWHLGSLLAGLGCFTIAGFTVGRTLGFLVAGCCFLLLRTLVDGDAT